MRMHVWPHLPAAGHRAAHKDIDIFTVEGLEDGVVSEGRRFLCTVIW